MKTYDLLFKVPISGSASADGVRDTDEFFMRSIDRLVDDLRRGAGPPVRAAAGRPPRGMGGAGEGDGPAPARPRGAPVLGGECPRTTDRRPAARRSPPSPPPASSSRSRPSRPRSAFPGPRTAGGAPPPCSWPCIPWSRPGCSRAYGARACRPRRSFAPHTRATWRGRPRPRASSPGPIGFAALLFVVLAAAHRWGLGAALVTAAATLGLEALSLGRHGTLSAGAFALATRGAALGAVGGMVGWLSAQQRRVRARDVFLARAVAEEQSAPGGVALALGRAFEQGRACFGASAVAVIVRESDTGRAFLWTVPRGGVEEGARAQATHLDPVLRDDWLFDVPARAWYAEERRDGPAAVLAVDGRGQPRRDLDAVPPAALRRLLQRWRASRVAAVAFSGGHDWEARVLLLDPDLGRHRLEELAFAVRLVNALGGVAQERFRLGRLRTRVGTMERARVARELHDGTIQSLVAIEMEMDVLRRRAERLGSPLAPEVERIERLLRDEVLELRDTMQRLKPIDITPTQLVGFLDATVARFGQDAGIRARFDCDQEDVDLPPRVCQEIARIVQEALHNVRKHSGAQHVVVRLRREPGGWRLVVDDDGQGFPFSGRLSHSELDSGRKGPHVIKERVRALGGELSIVTSPGGGAQLDILLPQAAR